jgi:hypothetical protein
LLGVTLVTLGKGIFPVGGNGGRAAALLKELSTTSGTRPTG